MSPSENPEAEFAYGSGLLNPVKATNPGLIYDASEEDYLLFLCQSGYKKDLMVLISGNISYICQKEEEGSSIDVNYPAMQAMVAAEKPYNVTFKRLVTNVGVAGTTTTYTVKVATTKSMEVKVMPNLLTFEAVKEIKSFEVNVVGKGLSSSSQLSGSLLWFDGVHQVRTSIVIYTH